MKKIIFVLFFAVLGGAVFAGGEMDASMVSDEDVARVERIVQALDPEAAIQTALDSFTGEYPLIGFLDTQEMKINRIFNEYGVEFNQYTSYKGLPSQAHVAFAKLKSRYSYLYSIQFMEPEELRAALALLKE
ncbi:MAG: hypothetical protein LBG05_05900 [Treponema sp.]|nr:hypothetical protein [Treponema sp.]